MTLTETKRHLDTSHRCDGCGAQAWVKVNKDDSSLLFCKHDFDKHEYPLIASGWIIDVDDRELIRDS